MFQDKIRTFLVIRESATSENATVAERESVVLEIRAEGP
jgi:hypothetical protein